LKDIRLKVQGARRTIAKAESKRAVGGEVAEDLFNRGLCLPSGTAMNEEDLERVASIIKRCRTKRDGRS
jgi:dTDP-4-amino-4,6-dideoxygalactose transaminase